MKNSLLQNLKNYYNQDFSSFHTPGHKGKFEIENINPFSLDYTELPETDSLFEDETILKESEIHASKVLNNIQTVYSTGGCTLCIQAMIYMALQRFNKKYHAPNERKIIIGRMIHASAMNTISLLDLTPIYVMPNNISSGDDFPQYAITSEGIKKALQQNSNVMAVYITCPDYYGTISDVKAISEICHSYDVPLLIDNAHGAHLGLVDEKFNPSRNGADLVASSAHKTLPVLTGGAYLEVNNNEFYNMAKSSMRLFGSTSPSYPIMISIDSAINWIENGGKEQYKQLAKRVEKIKQYAKKLGFIVLKGDSCRITLGVQNFKKPSGESCNATNLFNVYRENKVQPEYADDSFVVLIATPFNSERDFLRVEQSLINFSKKYTFSADKNYNNTDFNFALKELPNRLLTPRQTLFSEYEVINIDDAEGRIAYETACPCPPGVPIVMPGEIITINSLKFLKKYRFLKLKVVK